MADAEVLEDGVAPPCRFAGCAVWQEAEIGGGAGRARFMSPRGKGGLVDSGVQVGASGAAVVTPAGAVALLAEVVGPVVVTPGGARRHAAAPHSMLLMSW